MEGTEIKNATQEAVDAAAEAVEESAKAVTDAVETAVENAAAKDAAAKAVEETARAVDDAVETAAENVAATTAVTEAVETSARKNADATETAAVNQEAMQKKKPQIPETKDESMQDYKEVIDRSMRKIGIGDVVTGTVIAVSEEEATLDLAHFAGGVIRRADFSPDPKFNILDDVRIGDEITAVVKKTDDGQGNLVLSAKEAAQQLSWDKLKEAMDKKESVSVKISEAVKAGVIGYPMGIRAFIPASKLSLSFVEEKDLPSYIGRTLEARVITCDKKENKLVMSARDILREQKDKERAAKVSNLKPGLVTEGVVESLTDFGAFVDLGEGLTGLVHVSRISQERIRIPADVLKTGDRVKVKVMAVKDGKISLSMKDVEGQQAVAVEEESYEYKSQGEVTTSLADLIKQAGF